MPRILADDFCFVTNNAADFRRLYTDQQLHAGLVILVPQVVPATQREIFSALLDQIEGEDLINEAIEIRIVDGEAIFDRYTLPRP